MTAGKLAILLVAVALAATGQLVLKRGMTEAQASARRTGHALLLAAIGSPWVLAGLGIFVASAIAWLVTLAAVPLSVAYPFNAAGYVAILAASTLVLHERTSPWTWLGTLLVGSGLVLVVVTAPHSTSSPAKAHHATTVDKAHHPVNLARDIHSEDSNAP